MTEGGAALTSADLWLEAAAGKSQRKWAQQRSSSSPDVMGYPAACLLTPLPATLMPVPIVPQSPLWDDATQTTHGVTHATLHTRTDGYTG